MTRIKAAAQPAAVLAALLLALWLPLLAAAQPSPFYEVDALNEGLGPAPPDLDRETPQATVESLLALAEEGGWERAAHLLDLGEIEPGRQPALGPITADKLHTVLDRKLVLSWSQLLDRPDALDERATSNSAVGGQARRSILLGVLDLDDRTVPIRLDRVRPEDGGPVWVFSRQTVENVDALYGLYGPSRLELALPDPLRGEAFWGLMWWEVIGLPLMVGFAVWASVTTYRVTRWGARRASGTWRGIVWRSLRWPATLAALSTVLWCAALIFTFSGVIDAVLSPAIVLGFALAFLVFAVQVLDAMLDRLITFEPMELSEPGEDERRSWATMVSAVRRVILLAFVLAALGMVLASIGVFRTFGFSLLASAGALTLVLGFAARRVLGNILASLQIMLNRSARIGDQIIYDGDWCTVERIHFTYIQLKVWTGIRLVVPVEKFVSEHFANWTHTDPQMTNTVHLKLAGTADVEAMRRRFHELVQGEDEVVDPSAAMVLVTEQDALGQTVRFQFPSPDPTTGWYMECRVRERLIAHAARLEEETGRATLPEGAASDVAA